MKGYELIKEIADGKIKENTQIEVHDLTVLDKVIAIIEYKNGRLNWVEGTFDTSYLVSLNCYFKIIEEQEEINIQEIKPLNAYKLMESPYMAKLLKEQRYDEFMEHLKQSELELVENIGRLRDAVKQLDKKIKEKE